MIRLENLKKNYPDGRNTICALDLQKAILEPGSRWALVGPSGSGKSTLLHCLAGLTPLSEGTIEIDGQLMNNKNPQELAKWRGKEVGYIFQNLSLLPALSAEDNVFAGAFFAGCDKSSALQKEVDRLFTSMGITDIQHKLPRQLSQGQQQRVAIARALIKKPKYILADEPTASLDRETAKQVMQLLLSYSQEQGTTLLISTHDPAIQTQLDHELRLGAI
ncbi:MAG: ABC transporter ATP-binding protein [Alcaligenaceae bacterium]|nr:ABC transporter ATP-binding protein [Alcaligenaceae bacterium]